MGESKYVPSKEAEAILDGYRLLDDNFMTLFFDQNFEATALMLNVILGRNDIQILRMEVQKVEKSPSADGRSVVLDIFAVDASGKHYDVEVQRADHGADKKRARFLSGVLDSRMLKASEDFVNLNESYVIFITEKDVMGAGLPMYHVNRVIEELNTAFDDGNHIIYVNGAYKNDSSDIGKLMHDFRCTSSIDMFYDVLKSGMHHYKETEGGRATVCKAIELYGKEQRMAAKREMAISLSKQGVAIEVIAQAAGVAKEVVKQWLIPASA